MRAEVVVVYKKSQLRLALDKRNSRIMGLLKRRDPSVLALQAANDAHEATLAEVERALKAAKSPFQRVYRARLKGAMTVGKLVVSVGGDGTLLDASHKIGASPVLGVNSDTTHSVGFLCASNRTAFAMHLDEILSGRWPATAVRRLQGTVDNEPLPFPVLNDVLLAHANAAATSRYLVERGGRVEDHKSSGVWISSAAGSSAAMASAGGQILAIDDERWQLRVREPFVADGPPLSLASLLLAPDDEVVITSKMREGRVYLDGPHEMIALPMGARLLVHGRAAPLHLFTTEAMAARRAVAAQIFTPPRPMEHPMPAKKKPAANKPAPRAAKVAKVAKVAKAKRALPPPSTVALVEGKKAPALSLPGDDGAVHSLAQHKGKPVVVYFYPRDDTPGCTTEACDFRDNMKRLSSTGALVYGISRDTLASHGKFKSKHKLNFTLLSDEDLAVHVAWGAWGDKVLYGQKTVGVIRSTYLIGADGTVARAWAKVKVAGHVDDVLAALAAL